MDYGSKVLRMLGNASLADVLLNVEEPTSNNKKKGHNNTIYVPAHRVILAAASPMLNDMFSSGLKYSDHDKERNEKKKDKKDKKKNDDGKEKDQGDDRDDDKGVPVCFPEELAHLPVVQVDYSFHTVFKYVLAHMYGARACDLDAVSWNDDGTVDMDGGDENNEQNTTPRPQSQQQQQAAAAAAEASSVWATRETCTRMLDCATFYQLQDLRDEAFQRLMRRADDSNVTYVLNDAIRFNCTRLQDYCITFIRQHNVSVLDAENWVELPRDEAYLLIRETVVDSEMKVLQKCVEWAETNALRKVRALPLPEKKNDDAEDEEAAINKMADQDANENAEYFLDLIDFTLMSAEELQLVESGPLAPYVPLTRLYQAFKHQHLRLDPLNVQRKGGIVLEWNTSPWMRDPAATSSSSSSARGGPFSRSAFGEQRSDQQQQPQPQQQQQPAKSISFENNRVVKLRDDGNPSLVSALNKFTCGRHYFVFAISEARSQRDLFVGVSAGHNADFHFEPGCMKVCCPPYVRVEKENDIEASLDGAGSIFVDGACAIGVLLDFVEGKIEFHNHYAKRKLFVLTVPPDVLDANGKIRPESSTSGNNGGNNAATTPTSAQPFSFASSSHLGATNATQQTRQQPQAQGRPFLPRPLSTGGGGVFGGAQTAFGFATTTSSGAQQQQPQPQQATSAAAPTSGSGSGSGSAVVMTTYLTHENSEHSTVTMPSPQRSRGDEGQQQQQPQGPSGFGNNSSANPFGARSTAPAAAVSSDWLSPQHTSSPGGSGSGSILNSPFAASATMLQLHPPQLPTPLTPSVVLAHKANGHIVLSETTTFVYDPSIRPPTTSSS